MAVDEARVFKTKHALGTRSMPDTSLHAPRLGLWPPRGRRAILQGKGGVRTGLGTFPRAKPQMGCFETFAIVVIFFPLK